MHMQAFPWDGGRDELISVTPKDIAWDERIAVVDSRRTERHTVYSPKLCEAKTEVSMR
jgi:hypothetical protein